MIYVHLCVGNPIGLSISVARYPGDNVLYKNDDHCAMTAMWSDDSNFYQ